MDGRLELGANVGWTSGENATKFAVAAKYQLAPETVLRAKVLSALSLRSSWRHPPSL